MAQQPNYNNLSQGLSMDNRSVCRSLNSRITDPTTNIEVPPNLLNQFPTSFPSNISQLRGLTVTVKLTIQNRQAAVSVVPTASTLVIRALKEPPRDCKKEKNVKHAGTVKEVLGKCFSVGCTVDGPRDLCA
ncbi:14708_t:CDS:2 [Entrophospora sp. SA101]|nr:14708_t:CDS:2 [Entrophospora sp. SA101]